MQTDLELFLIGWLQPSTTARVCNETPAEDDWPTDSRIVRIVDIGGTDPGRTLAAPIAAFDFLAANRRDVIQLSLDVHELMRRRLLGQRTPEGQTVNAVTTFARPGWGPTESPTLKHRTASYQLLLH